MAINFPDSPNNGDSFTSNNKTWVYDGTVWNITFGTTSVADDAITTAKLAADSVTTAKILDANITAAKLASDAVTTAKITDANITAAKLASDAVTTAKILDANITTDKIASDAVTTAKILDANITTAKIESNAVTTGKLGTDVQLGYRNVIINGAMQVAQRGTSFSFPSAGGGYWWGADRFSTIDYTWTAGSNITVSQETSVVPTGFNSAYKIATGATGLTFGSGGVMRIRTFIEGFNMRAHYSKTMTLSFWVRSSIAGTYNLFLENANWDISATTRAFQPEYTISAANTWEKKTITIDMASATSAGTWGTTNGIGLGITWCLGANANRTGDTYKSGWTTYSSVVVQTSTATQWATNANATFYLTGVQLEAGAVATPFEFEDYGTTLAKCKRYFHREGDNNYYIYTTLTDWSTGNGYATFRAPVEMRTTPTLSYSSLSNFRIYASGSTANPTSIVEWTPGLSSGKLSFGVNITASNFSGGTKSGWISNNNAPSGWIGLSAEL